METQIVLYRISMFWTMSHNKQVRLNGKSFGGKGKSMYYIQLY